MRKILYLAVLTLLTTSCVRRELTYEYFPTIDVIINVHWVDMSETPTGMSIYCYPEDGGSPTTKQTNNVSSTSISLGVGKYKVLVFNQIPSEFTTVDFVGLDSYETAEINAVSTKSTWYESKADDETLVIEPDEIAVATYHDLEISQEEIDAMLDEYMIYKSKSKSKGSDDYEDEDDVDFDEVFTYNIEIDVYPAVVVRTTRVTVEVDGVNNLGLIRSTLHGMASGYNISEQISHSDYTTHLLETWSISKDASDNTHGSIVTYFNSFGLPETTTTTRTVDESWGGTLYLEMMLLNSEVVTSEHLLYDKVTLLTDVDSTTNKSGDDEEETYDDSDVDISIDIYGEVTLPDVEIPEGETGSSGGFDVSVGGWDSEEKIEIEF